MSTTPQTVQVSSFQQPRVYPIANPAAIDSGLSIKVIVDPEKFHLSKVSDRAKEAYSLRLIESFLYNVYLNQPGNTKDYGGPFARPQDIQGELLGKVDEITAIELQCHQHDPTTNGSTTKDANRHTTINVFSDKDPNPLMNMAFIHIYEKGFKDGAGFQSYCIVQGPNPQKLKYLNRFNDCKRDENVCQRPTGA